MKDLWAVCTCISVYWDLSKSCVGLKGGREIAKESPKAQQQLKWNIGDVAKYQGQGVCLACTGHHTIRLYKIRVLFNNFCKMLLFYFSANTWSILPLGMQEKNILTYHYYTSFWVWKEERTGYMTGFRLKLQSNETFLTTPKYSEFALSNTYMFE